MMSFDSMSFRVVPATPRYVEAINSVIQASKSFWDYEYCYLQAAIPLLLIDVPYFERNLGWLIVSDINKEGVLGFMGAKIEGNHCHLEHLWISPGMIKKGLGTLAVEFLLKEMKNRGVQEVRVLPDPPAEVFYFKLGAIFTGSSSPSRIPCGPTFREMAFQIGK
jgi:hypothetical protein